MIRSWVNFRCRGVLLVWIIVGQGRTALAIGAGGGCLDMFPLIYHFSFLSPSLWETARYRLKYCLKGPLNPNNQPKKSPKERETGEKGQMRVKCPNNPHNRTYRKCSRPLPYYHPNSRTPRHWKFTQGHRTTHLLHLLFPQRPYMVCANFKCSDKTARMHRLV